MTEADTAKQQARVSARACYYSGMASKEQPEPTPVEPVEVLPAEPKPSPAVAPSHDDEW